MPSFESRSRLVVKHFCEVKRVTCVQTSSHVREADLETVGSTIVVETVGSTIYVMSWQGVVWLTSAAANGTCLMSSHSLMTPWCIWCKCQSMSTVNQQYGLCGLWLARLHHNCNCDGLAHCRKCGCECLQQSSSLDIVSSDAYVPCIVCHMWMYLLLCLLTAVPCRSLLTCRPCVWGLEKTMHVLEHQGTCNISCTAGCSTVLLFLACCARLALRALIAFWSSLGM